MHATATCTVARSPVAIQHHHHHDHAESSERQKEQAFLSWLSDNGAVFDSVEWPSRETGSQLRGGVARRDIATGEFMVTIPHRLLMSEFHARDDPDLGHVHRENARLLKGDNGLAVYIMQEVLKGESSLYWPYVRVLPQPHNLRHWGDESLLDLQDPRLVRRTASRIRQLRALYRDTLGFLSRSYPALFPADRYTFELFDFAWSTVQARAFGKRLKCSALVPFADCLNHGNVQTKYDLDVDGNGMFRLYPSGTNLYPRGAAVLNSYGRRANDNLLLEYGFAMLDNEWDAAEVACSLQSGDSLFERRKACLRASGQRSQRLLRLRGGHWSVDILRFNRCVCLTESDLDTLELGYDERHPPSEQHQSQQLLEAGGADTGGEKKSDGVPCAILPADRSSRLRAGTTVENDQSARSSRGRTQFVGDDGSGEPDGGQEEDDPLAMGFPCRALSAGNELAALTEIVVLLLEARDAYPTTLEHDERLLQEVKADTAPELLNALKYRITVKRILAQHLDMAEQAIAFVQGIAKQLESVDDETIDGVARCCREPRTTTAGTGESPLPPSFLSYLSDTEKTLLLRQAPPLKRPSVGDGGGSSGHERRRGLQPRARKIVEDADDNAKPPSACDCSGTEGSVSIGRCADGSQTEPVPCSTLSV